MSAPTFAYVGRYEDHLKFQGRAPRNLTEKAIARADSDHRARVAEVKKMASKLAQLDAFVPQIAAAGVNLADRTITTHDGGKTLRIQPTVFQADDKLCAALLAAGFREVERKEWGPREDLVTLKHGRSLLVRIDVAKAAAPAVQAVSSEAKAA